MEKLIGFLNFKLPTINPSNNISKNIKENNKNSTQKINLKNVQIFYRNNPLTNNLKNLSRNSFKSKDKISQKRLTVIYQEKNNSEKSNCKKKQLKNPDINNNNNIIYNYSKNKKIIPFINLNSAKKINNITKSPSTASTPKNSYYLSIYPKNGNINNNLNNSNFSLYKNENVKNNSISIISTNKKCKSYKASNKDLSKINNYAHSENANKKSEKINLEYFLRKQEQNLKNIKFKLLMPKILNLTINSKKFKIYSQMEDNKISKKNDDKIYTSQSGMLKDLINIENLNHINNLVQILKQYILLENAFNIFINEEQTVQNLIKSAKDIIQLYNIFFNQLDNISLEINILLFLLYIKT